jgi:hypothetical protein
MGVKLFFLLFVLASCATKQQKNWREEIRLKHKKGYRVSFGESSLVGGEEAAIKTARSNALGEMGKTFFVKVSSSADSSLKYDNTPGKESTTQQFNSKIFEESRTIELSGIDLTSMNIDYEKNYVTVAAIINLEKFKNHLEDRILQNTEHLKEKINLMNCSNRNDLKRIRDVSNSLSKALENELILASFTQVTTRMQEQSQKYLEFTRNCRGRFSFEVKSQNLSASEIIKRAIEADGFRFQGRSGENGNITIEIKENISPPEIKFDRINLLGKIDIILTHSKDKFTWTSPTIRQIDSSERSALMKLNVRLIDEVEKGVKDLIKENF